MLRISSSGLNRASKEYQSINKDEAECDMKVGVTITKLLALADADGSAGPIVINFPVLAKDHISGKKLVFLSMTGLTICGDIDATNKNNRVCYFKCKMIEER